MEEFLHYIKPELMVVAVVLYFIGAGLKKAQAVEDKYIPLVLGAIGIALCAVYVLSACDIDSVKDIATAVFTALIQGILVAGMSAYIHQLVKQMNKKT